MNNVSNSMSENGMSRTNRKHKERVFLMLYSDKRELLKIYNAINGTDYDNPDELEIVTLGNAIYVDKVRRYQKVMFNDEAVRRAVYECIEENILKDFFMKQKEKVIAMSILEYDEEAVLDYIGQKQWEDGRNTGRLEGKLEGKLDEQLRLIISKVRKNKTLAEIAEVLELDESVITSVYIAVCKCGPDYDVDKICKLVCRG